MTRIDVSMIYTHLIWTHFFIIYLIMACMGIYSIWTDLQEARGRKYKKDFEEAWDLMIPVGKELAEYELDKSTGEVVRK